MSRWIPLLILLSVFSKAPFRTEEQKEWLWKKKKRSDLFWKRKFDEEETNLFQNFRKPPYFVHLFFLTDDRYFILEEKQGTFFTDQEIN